MVDTGEGVEPGRRGAVAAVVVLLGVLGFLTWSEVDLPGRAPRSLEFGGRDYARADDAASVLDGFAEAGEVEGRTVYCQPGCATSVPTLIQVREGGELWWYDLVGGP